MGKEIKKNILVGIIVGIIVIFGFKFTVFASDNSLGEIWATIGGLREQISQLFAENKELKNNDLNLQNQISEIRSIDPSPTSSRPFNSLHVFDANQQDLGVLVDTSHPQITAEFFTTYLASKSVFLTFNQSLNRVVKIGSALYAIYYLQENCSGNPYANNSGNPQAVISSFNDRFFEYTAGDILYHQQSLSSWSYPDGCSNVPYNNPLYPLREISLPFSLPLAWPLQIKVHF